MLRGSAGPMPADAGSGVVFYAFVLDPPSSVYAAATTLAVCLDNELFLDFDNFELDLDLVGRAFLGAEDFALDGDGACAGRASEMGLT